MHPSNPVLSRANALLFAGMPENPASMPAWKRAGDVVFALLALPLLAAGTLLMTVVTSLVSPGPVFFRQQRVGRGGRLFSVFKFRTMRVGADTTVHQNHFKGLIASNAPMLKLDAQGDARLIPGGWLLRASGMDELPQLINVLRGEMSLIGPRPCIPNEFEQMTPAQHERVGAVPGLTGLWQVSGKNRTTFEEMIRLDVHYAHHVSMLGDLRIVLLTPIALLVQISEASQRRRLAASGLGPGASNSLSAQAALQLLAAGGTRTN
jgi:lipopolysaccharide/colanic/teichoic acid biosynthesis glycosyltransferase